MELKNIPTGWKETTLGDISLRITDGTHSTVIDTEDGKYFLLSCKNIKDGNVVFGNNERKIDEKTLIFLRERTKLEKNDVLVTSVGTIGEVAYIKEENPVYEFQRSVAILKPDSRKVLPLFLFYNLFGRKRYLEQNAEGAVQQCLFLGRIKGLSILLPPLPEQRGIAEMLSSFDAKIELLREQNETLEKTAQTIFHEWFGRYSVDAPEDLPEGWRVGKITEIIKREPVSYKCDKKDLDPNGVTPIIDQGTTALYGYTSRNPDFLASPEKPVIVFTNHTCNYWFIDYSFCAIQNVLPYRGKDGYDEYFLYFMTKGSINFIEYKGHWPDFEAKDFIIPTVEKAKEFSSIARPILEKISSNNSQIQSLSKTRDTLLPKLMSGEVRIV